MLRRFIIFVVLVIPLFVLAQGTAPYFEFAPKISEPIDIDDQTGDVYELFLPQNDHVSGFDIWIDNPGVGGEVSFGLRRDGISTLLSAATVNIAANVDPSFGGNRIHIDFPSNIAVNSDDIYSIKIFSETPDFRVYHADRRSILLEHTAPYTSEYINGVARIDGIDQDFSFTFALYETAETVAPVVTNATTTIINLNEIELGFNANEPIDFRVQYSPAGGGLVSETSFAGEYTLCSQGATPCVAVLAVNPDTTYNYVLTVQDEWGNQTQLNGSFDSAESPEGTITEGEEGGGDEPGGDTTPPTVSGLQAVSVMASSAQITWNTNEAARGTLNVTTDSGGVNSVALLSDSVYQLVHTFTVTGLDAETAYYAHASVQDAVGNVSGGSINFTTLAASTEESTESESTEESTTEESSSEETTSEESSESTSATPSSSSAPSASFSDDEGTTDGGTISGKGSVSFQWTKPAETPDGYRIDVFDEDNNLVQQIFVDSGDVTETVIRGLAPGRYTILLYSNRGGIFERIADPTEIVVLPRTLLEQIIRFWYIYIAVIAVIVVVPWYFIKKERARLAEVEE